MLEPASLKAVVHSYLAAFNAGKPDKIAALFNDEASVEDPIGTTPHIGPAAIEAFYTRAIATGSKIELAGQIRVSGQHAAFPFAVRLELEGVPHQIDVIDTFRFDNQGRIAEMRAYFDAIDFPVPL